MPITTGDLQEKFGTQTQVLSSSSITGGAMSTQANAIAWTNSDNAPDGEIVFECALAGAPATGGAVEIFSRKLNVRLTNDQNEPSLTDNENDFKGAMAVDLSNPATQRMTKRIQLHNLQASQQYEFYFLNRTNQNATGCVAYITPVSNGPVP